jgi:hypothetical protein
MTTAISIIILALANIFNSLCWLKCKKFLISLQLKQKNRSNLYSARLYALQNNLQEEIANLETNAIEEFNNLKLRLEKLERGDKPKKTKSKKENIVKIGKVK